MRKMPTMHVAATVVACFMILHLVTPSPSLGSHIFKIL
jgi:hypothetical protein